MSASGYDTRLEQLPVQLPDDDDVLVRSSTWSPSGGTEIKSQIPTDDSELFVYGDSKCYGGRFTYGQWRRFFAQRHAAGTQQDASGQVISSSISRDFSWNAFVQYFRPEIWLLVLLHADAIAMSAIASCCEGFRQVTLPWRHLGNSASKGEVEKEMPVAQLAARLRSGLPLAEELLGLPAQITLPCKCRSWLDLLHHQEMEGWKTGLLCLAAWICAIGH